MARPALSASRGLDILDLLAAFPGRAFSLSEIARAADINAASCHAVVAALADRGYLERTADRRGYRLGAVLVAVGGAALKAQPLAARAIAAADALCAELAIPVLITRVIGGEVVCLHARTVDGRDAGMGIGERRPLVPPVGATFFAWAGEEAVAGWMARHDPPADVAAMAGWRRTLELTRRRGAQVTLRKSDGPAVAALMAQLADRGRIPDYKDAVARLFNAFDDEMDQPETIDPARLYDIVLIAAPVFDAAGGVAFSLCLGGFGAPLAGSAILGHVDRLVRICLRIAQEERAQGRSAAD